MENLLTVAFEAHHTEHNHHRRYSIVIGSDLLNGWTLSICYGRIGQRGQELRFASSEAGELQMIVRNCLRRRLSAPQRINCSYRLKELNSSGGSDTEPWLPNAIIGRFFKPTKG